MNETNLVRTILLAASDAGHRLFRQNTGQGWIGNSTRLPNGDVLIKNARPFHAGFEGLSDTGGWARVVITPDMVGKTIAQAAYVEIKTARGRLTPKQKAFLAAAQAAGCRAGIARTVSEALAILDPTQ